MSIKLENISYTYQIGRPFEKLVLENISLEIRENTIVGIMGATSSGKTTLLQILAGLLTVQKGQVIIDNDIKVNTQNTFVNSVGLVFQFPEMQFILDRVFDEIAYSLTFLKLKQAEIKNRVLESMEIVGLPGAKYKDRRIENLSSGEKRRVAIATILALDRKYILLDEPTAALDYPGRQDLQKLILRLRDSNKTVVIVSHDLSYLLEMCDEIYIISKGRVAMVLSSDLRPEKLDSLKTLSHPLPAYMETAIKLKKKGFDLRLENWTEDALIEEIIATLVSGHLAD
ncbi:MAG TPA: ATP-binding cassette domain-containing protein [Syntrophomonadaceae bacterium]|nr:ATP-binding cassette domain-containing protein [Syntrophomonadaceae bacterium]